MKLDFYPNRYSSSEVGKKKALNNYLSWIISIGGKEPRNIGKLFAFKYVFI